MGARFIAVPADGGVVAELGALLPANPFATAGFFESRRQVGYAAWVMGLRDDAGGLECGSGAFLRTGALNRALEIPSLPSVGAESPFWVGLREFCRHHGVTRLDLGTFATPPGVEIPALGAHCRPRNRCEFVLPLTGDLDAMLSKRHRYSVKKAQKAGLGMRRARSAEAASVHRSLMNQSTDRRLNRGETASPIGPSPEHLAFLESGAGELFQAVRGDTVLSSVLVLRAKEGAYEHSSGTSPEGMAVGASPFLIHAVASQLSADGAGVLNLGGADVGTGLALFKEGFGASRVFLPSASCDIGPSWRRWAGAAIALGRSSAEAVKGQLIDRVSRMIVYSADTGSIGGPEPGGGLAFQALTPEDLRGLSVGDPTFRAQQLDRLSRFGTSHAYAVVADGQIAHVSWLLPPSAMERDPPRVVKAQAGAAEITACETLPEFRGRGIYGFAIRSLMEVARGQGAHRVWMKTAVENRASQAGIEKAGLARVGTAVLILLPVTQRLVVWRRFR